MTRYKYTIRKGHSLNCCNFINKWFYPIVTSLTIKLATMSHQYTYIAPDLSD